MTAATRVDGPRAEESASVAEAAGGAGAGRWRALCSTCRQIFGMPDYDRYLAHAAATHPGAPVLTHEEFVARAIERRYGAGGARCC
jgi:uncharacterized short protein YbdD (DUF466 family)